MEKAIKDYLRPYGFKYVTSAYEYEKKVDNDISHAIGYIHASGYRKHYYHLRIFVTISSNALNDVLFEVTNGLMDYRNSTGSPAYLNVYNDEVIEMEFCGERSIEDNIKEFDSIYRLKIQNLFDTYNSTKSIILCPINESHFNVLNTPYIWYYVPLAYFFNGDFEKAFDYIDYRIGLAKESESRILARCGHLEDSVLKTRFAYENMRNSLMRWISERRQLNVNNELLPQYI